MTMPLAFTTSGDLIATLPTDEVASTYDEMDIVNKIFSISPVPTTTEGSLPLAHHVQSSLPPVLNNIKRISPPQHPPMEEFDQVQENFNHLVNHGSTVKSICFQFQDILIATVIFVLLSLPPIDALIEKLTAAKNIYTRLFIKTVIFALLFLIITSILHCRESSKNSGNSKR